jgi:cytochrome c-type biogenesis protein CcmH
MLKSLLALLCLLAAPLWAAAADVPPLAKDPALEARVMTIAEELRCLVCQNETLAASQAPLAVDLRGQIRVKLAAGQSEQQIVDFMVERYGDFVRYRPPFKASTALLWAGPFVLLGLAAWVLVRTIRRRRAAAPALATADAERARRLLDNGDDDGGARP